MSYPFLIVVLMSVVSMPVAAYLDIRGSDDFKQQVEAYLEQGRKISHHTRRLIDEAGRSRHPIRIRALTDDPKTWHRNGDASRSHTRVVRRRAEDGQTRGVAGARIYINPKRISATDKTYSHGTLIHELVHALDLVNDHYHEDYVIREKRAVFFQNIWREAHGKRLRKHYHKKFDTLEYQQASENGRIGEFVEYYFTHDDLPAETASH